MNKKILIAVTGASLWLASSVASASIAAECAEASSTDPNYQHSEEVCPNIAIVQAELREFSMPEAPVLDDLIGEVAFDPSGAVTTSGDEGGLGGQVDTDPDSLL